MVAITDINANILSQQRYLPFGQVRTDTPPIPNSPITQTDLGFTGQRNLDTQGNVSLGLMDYHARMYDSYITQAFIQPDDIIPDYKNPQSLNRYAYALGNPIRYNDPSGHCADPVTAEICGAAAFAGPPGWVVIGVLLIVDVVIIAKIASDASQQSSDVATLKHPLVNKMKGEYIPPGLDDAERAAYREALHRYKDAWGIPAGVDIPHDILDKMAKDIKNGKKPVDAADDADEPPEADTEHHVGSKPQWNCEEQCLELQLKINHTLRTSV